MRRSAAWTRPHDVKGSLDIISARELLITTEVEIDYPRLSQILSYMDGLTKCEAADRLGVSVVMFLGRFDRGQEKVNSSDRSSLDNDKRNTQAEAKMSPQIPGKSGNKPASFGTKKNNKKVTNASKS